MLIAIIVGLQPVEKVEIPRSHGHFAYTAILDLILKESPALSHRLHELRPKPFTVSPLSGPALGKSPHLVLHPDAVYTWRWTGLTEEVSECLLKIASDVHAVRIGPAVFHVVSCATRAHEHAEAGRDTYAELRRRWENAHPPATVTLTFQTPTTFRVGRYEMPLPIPRLVFGSLVDMWNAFAPEPLGDWREVMNEIVVLSNWRGETRRVEMGHYRTVGFVGRCTFRVPPPIPEIRRMLGMLAEFAFYAGVGWQRAHGMGQVRFSVR